ncbi:MAG: hypothetical protein ACI4W7_04700 [Candidatus Spyradenecus sp.]
MKQTATAPRDFAEEIQVAEAWLQDRAPGFAEVTKVPGYALWAFDHPVVGNGLLELIDNAEISQGGAVVALSAQLMVAPPKTLEESLGVLRLNEWLCGCAIVFKEISSDGDLVLEGKFPLEELSCARLDKLLRVLTDGKHYLES